MSKMRQRKDTKKVNEYMSKHVATCSFAMQLGGGVHVCCDLVKGHRFKHESEVRTVDGQVFVVEWRPKRGEN